jgi:predicted signal transduction protein with EAL and GGDEF domain
VTVGVSDPAALLRAADLAMYRAKAAGRGGVAVSEQGMDDTDADRLALRVDLSGAVDRREIEVEFRPIVDLATGATAGFEALPRWNHPERGPIAPAAFLPLAEETGLIREIGRRALRASRARAAARGHTVTVHVSGCELAAPGLPAAAAAALAETGLPAESLVLAVAQDAVMQDLEASATRLGELKALGVRLVVDDAGPIVRAIRDLVATLGLHVGA